MCTAHGVVQKRPNILTPRILSDFKDYFHRLRRRRVGARAYLDFFVTEPHPSVVLIAQLSGQVVGYAFTSPDGRYQAAEVGGDTVIVDLRERRQHRASGVYPRGFDADVLEVEGAETATAYLPAWTDLQQISLEHTPADFWSPWPDPSQTG